MGKRKPSKPVADDEAMDVDTFLATSTAPAGVGSRELEQMRGIGSLGRLMADMDESALLREYDRLLKTLGGESKAESAVVTKTGLQPSEFWKLPKVDRVRYLRLAAGCESGADTADTRENSLPESPDVRDLCKLLQDGIPKRLGAIAIARKFTGETAGKDAKAQSLLRQARRYKHLWKPSGQ